MKITFPHLGNVYLGAKALFDGLDIDYVIPSFSSKESLEIGVLNSPDEICLPFKVNIGNYIDGIKKGADTVIITGSCGPCRFGEYCEMQMNTLRRMGYDVDFIVLDVPRDIGFDNLLARISKIGSPSKKSRLQKYKALYDGIIITKRIDALEAKCRMLAGYEVQKDSCSKLLNSCKRDLLNCTNPDDMSKILSKYEQNLSLIEIDKNRDPIKIAIIGEIYTIIEPFSNLYIEDKLMKYGVSTRRNMTPSWWVKNTVLLSPLKLGARDLKEASKEYLSLCIGGHAEECIGEAILAKKHGFDGAIQIYPMGCMPEIVAKSILPAVSKDKNIPIMSLVVDEMTGEAGYITRIEAFIDLLERRRQNVLSGC